MDIFKHNFTDINIKLRVQLVQIQRTYIFDAHRNGCHNFTVLFYFLSTFRGTPSKQEKTKTVQNGASISH